MLRKLSLEKFMRSLEKPRDRFFKRALVVQEIMADRFTPITLFEILSKELQGGVILESGLQDKEMGRYSFLAFEPIAGLEFVHGSLEPYYESKKNEKDHEPFTRLRSLIKELDCACASEFQESITKIIGFVGYDAIRLFEEIPDRHLPDEMLPEISFHCYSTTLTFDHHRKTILISSLVEIGNEPEQAYQRGEKKIEELIKKISSSSLETVEPLCDREKNTFETSGIGDEDFIKLVERAQGYIKQGDAFQIVLSRCFKKNYYAKPFDIYRALRQVSPAPYMFYIPLGDRVIVGASPERMLSVYQNKVTINPIAGTRERRDPEDHQKIEEELFSDQKELAEHRMLVDLARNDLGRVCVVGSVQVDELAKVKHYSHVSHLVSVVSGTIAEPYDFLDALTASFPAGTLSGAPKIRAMQLIDELEHSRRGLYGGMIGRLDYADNFDSCIAIRMASLKDGVATIRAGAGIVHDSIPQVEANETRQKASSLLAAIHFAEGGK